MIASHQPYKMVMSSTLTPSHMQVSRRADVLQQHLDYRYTQPLLLSAVAEFLEWLCRCALVAYRYSPSSPPQTACTFESSYSTHAKQLWLQPLSNTAGSAAQWCCDAERDNCVLPACVCDSTAEDDSSVYKAVGVSVIESAHEQPAAHKSAMSGQSYEVSHAAIDRQPPVGGNSRAAHLRCYSPTWVAEPHVTKDRSTTTQPMDSRPDFCLSVLRKSGGTLSHDTEDTSPKHQQLMRDLVRGCQELSTLPGILEHAH